MSTPVRRTDVAVVGSGLAGLTAAVCAARLGAAVVLLDARHEIGGRASTASVDGFRFNQGPHALYKASDGAAVLRELGVVPAGGNPPLLRSRFSLDGTLRVAPPPRAISQLVGLFRRLGTDRRDPGLIAISAEEWIDGRLSDVIARQFAASAVRVSSYCGDLATFSADAAVAQLHTALRGITYLHGGWSQLVDGLEAAARTAGVTIDTGAKVAAIGPGDGDVEIELVDGAPIIARAAVIAAGGPGVAARLVGDRSPSLNAVTAAARPVHAACLDVGLRRLTRPSTRFVLGVDRPTYASVHTPGARLAEHGHVVHLMHYEPGSDIDVVDLEALADELQPGWRNEEAARQVGRRRVVAFDRPQPGLGLTGRPSAIVDDVPAVFVAGDWVGSTDLLGTAAITSGKAAGTAAVRHVEARRTTPKRATRDAPVT